MTNGALLLWALQASGTSGPSSFTPEFIFYLFYCKYTKLISTDSFKMVNMTSTEECQGLQSFIVSSTRKQPLAETASRAERGPRIQVHQAE